MPDSPHSEPTAAPTAARDDWEVVTNPAPAPSKQKPPAERRRFRKSNELVGIRAKKGRITLVTWKIHQALVYHAQQQHLQRQRDAAKGRPLQTGSFSLPLSELVASAHYGSNGLELLQ